MNLEMMKNLYDIDCDVHKFPDGTILYKFKNPILDKTASGISALLFYIKPDRISFRLERTMFVKGRMNRKTKKFRKIEKQFISKDSQFACISFKRNQCNFYKGTRMCKRSRKFRIFNLKNKLDCFKRFLGEKISAVYSSTVEFDMSPGAYHNPVSRINPKSQPMCKFIMDQVKRKFEEQGRTEEWKKFCEA